MKNIVAFGASSSSNSINQQLAKWAASQVEGEGVHLLDLNDYEMPIYSVDRERENGVPEKAQQFKQAIRKADGIIISFAEHNGSYTSAFKNVYDWVSRLERSVWSGKPMFLLAASPGPSGAKTVLSFSVDGFHYNGGQVVASFSLPSFKQNFLPNEGIVDEGLRKEFVKQLENFKRAVDENILTE